MARWIIDPDHTTAAFSVRHFMLARVRGQFNKARGVIQFEPGKMEEGSVEVEIDASAIYTGVGKRDEHLRSPDFFDVEQYPVISFRSTKVEPVGKDRLAVTGDLTIRGVTRLTVLDVHCFGPVKSPFDEDVSRGFHAELVIDRHEFGVSWNMPLDEGGVVVGDDVEVFIDAEGDLER